MKKLIGVAVIAIFLFFSVHLYAKTINSPDLSAEQAIALARQYVQNNRIDVSHHFLARVEYFNLRNEYEKPFWRIEYLPLTGGGPAPAGGQIIISVHQDGTVDMGVGE